jgi:hypothetical protein
VKLLEAAPRVPVEDEDRDEGGHDGQDKDGGQRGGTLNSGRRNPV